MAENESLEHTPTPTTEPGQLETGPETDAPPPPIRIIEALLFVGGEPLTPERAIRTIRGLTEESFHELTAELARTYRAQGRPYSVARQGGGYVLALRPAYRLVPQRLSGGVREVRLSPAAIEVLAVVAYRQPVTRDEVDALRGHESAAVLRQLVRRGLIRVVPNEDKRREPVRYATTDRFLEVFGLSSLNDLPQTEDVQRL